MDFPNVIVPKKGRIVLFSYKKLEENSNWIRLGVESKWPSSPRPNGEINKRVYKQKHVRLIAAP